MEDPFAVLLRLLLLTLGSALAMVWPRWWHSRHRPRVLSACCPLVIGSATAVSVGLAHGAPSWPLATAADRLMVIIIPACAVIGVVAELLSQPGWRYLTLRGAAAVLLTPVILHGSIYLAGDQAWSMVELSARSIVAGAAIMAGLAATERLATTHTRRLPLWVSAGVGLGASGVAMCSGSFSIGIANMGLSAALLGAALATIGGASMRVARACAPTAALLQGAFLIWGIYMAEVRPWHAVMLLLAPVAARIVLVGPARRWSGWRATLVGVAAAAVVALVPTVHALIQFMVEYNKPSGY